MDKKIVKVNYSVNDLIYEIDLTVSLTEVDECGYCSLTIHSIDEKVNKMNIDDFDSLCNTYEVKEVDLSDPELLEAIELIFITCIGHKVSAELV